LCAALRKWMQGYQDRLASESSGDESS